MTKKWLRDCASYSKDYLHDCIQAFDEAVTTAQQDNDRQQLLHEDDRVKSSWKSMRDAFITHYKLIMRFGNRLPKKLHLAKTEREEFVIRKMLHF